MSAGVLSDGSQVIVPTGSPSAVAPSLVRTQPSVEPSGSVCSRGTPAYATVVVNVPATSWAGVTTSSWPLRRQVAGRPSTRTAATRIPDRSRWKDDSGAAAVARSRVTAARWLVAGA